MQTRQYRSTQIPRGIPAYDAAAIRERLEAVNREYAQWSEFFASKQIGPLTFVYEDWVTDPQGAIESIGCSLNVRPPPAIMRQKINLDIQRDALTEEWRTRFLRETAGEVILDVR
jgi:LPS sulfotransferase NodH